jgi:hypothetical protein
MCGRRCIIHTICGHHTWAREECVLVTDNACLFGTAALMELPVRTPARKVEDRCEECQKRPSNPTQLADMQKALSEALGGGGSSHKGKSRDDRGKHGGRGSGSGSGSGISKGKGKGKA